MGSWVGLRVEEDNIASGFDSIMITTGGAYQLCEIQGNLVVTPDPFSVSVAAWPPPDFIAGIGAIPEGTGPINIASHLSSTDYVYTVGTSDMTEARFGSSATTIPIAPMMIINMQWRGVFCVNANTDWYISMGVPKGSWNISVYGYVRLKFY